MAYGAGVVAGPGTAAYRYAGRRFDAETGLYHNRARAYSPTLGRFLQADPIGTQGGINLYAYAGNDPINGTDPSGNATVGSDGSVTNVPALTFYNQCQASAAAVQHCGGAVADTMSPLDLLGGGGGLVRGLIGKSAAGGISEAVSSYAAIGSTGKIGEAALQALGGESQVFFKSSIGGRYVDQLVNGWAHESKVGYQSLTNGIQAQIMKDVDLINSGQITGSTWHFFTSPVTGVGGPSNPLASFLQQNGIGIMLH